jgi:sugar phosphate isomerase/epimerase
MDERFKAGVTSATLRQHAFRNFIKHVIKTDLTCIEWGSDIHVPYDAPDKAADVAAEMRLHNLSASSYGSYYRLGWLHEKNMFDMMLNVAKILGAPMIRIWGGGIASRHINAKMRREIIDDALKVAAAAKKLNIGVALEYHPESIADTPESAVDFMREVRNWGGSNIYLYWQPRPFLDFEENKRHLAMVLPFLSNIHVQSREGNTRFLLWEHMLYWKEYINIIKGGGGRHNFLLEFTKNDNPDFFVEDAKVLVDLLGEA